MPSIIQAGNAASTGLVTTGATDGILELRSGTAAGGTVAVTVDAAQNLVLAKGISVGASAAPAFSAFQSSAQAVPAGSFTKVLLQSKEFDTASAFDATTNYRFQPTVAGYYSVTAGVGTLSLGGNIAAIFKNGAEAKRGLQGAAAGGTLTAAGLIFLNGSTDFIELFVLFGNAANTTGTSAQTFLQAFLARSA